MAESISAAEPALAPRGGCELIPRVLSGGLGAVRRWARRPHLYSPRMCAVDITFANHSGQDVSGVRLHKKVTRFSLRRPAYLQLITSFYLKISAHR